MKLFLRIFITIYLLIGGMLTWLAFSMQPYSGDLTRIGGFLENDFGWNLPQEEFKQPLFKLVKSLAQYDQYYDVIVVGDSFSMNNAYGWQNYFVNATGLSLLTFHQDDVNINELLLSYQFRKNPPLLLIMETAEHGVQDRLLYFHKPVSVKKHPSISIAIPVKPLRQIPEVFYRPVTSELRMDESIHYIKMNVKKFFGSRKVFRYHLKRQHLFSCRRSDEILLYYADRLKNRIGAREWETVENRFADLQEVVESNGYTKLLTMIAPDKTTAYDQYIDNLEYPDHSVMSRLPGKRNLRILPLEKRLKEKIDAGTVDVYLSNDTHWGFEGHKTAAETLLQQISAW